MAAGGGPGPAAPAPGGRPALCTALYCSVVQVADLSLRSTEDCQDRLQVREEGLTLLTLCGDLEGRATVISTNNQVSQLDKQILTSDWAARADGC